MSRYQLGGLIGEGGMAQVLAASRRLANDALHAVAVKRLRPEVEASAVARARLDLEAQVGVALAHPNLVQVYDYDRIGKDRCIVMEHVDGLSLHDLARQVRLPYHVTRTILLELAVALSYVHEKGLLHRDVSPRNVLISSAGEVKLTDFGIVRVMGTPRTLPFFKGTAAYASPEALRGQELDPGADLYSLAAMAYELLTGAPPFGQGGPEEIIYRQDPASGWSMPPVPKDVPRDLRVLIASLMVSARERSLHSAEDVLVALSGSDEPMASKAEIAALIEGCMAAVIKEDRDGERKGRKGCSPMLFRTLLVLLLGIPVTLGHSDAPEAASNSIDMLQVAEPEPATAAPLAPAALAPPVLSVTPAPPPSKIDAQEVRREQAQPRARQVPRRPETRFQAAGAAVRGPVQMAPPVMKRARGLGAR